MNISKELQELASYSVDKLPDHRVIKATVINELINEAHTNAINKGWWEEEIINVFCEECGGSGGADENPCLICNELGYIKRTLPARTFGDQIALMHSELSEALEDFRSGTTFDHIWFTKSEQTKVFGQFKDMLAAAKDGWKPEGISVEFADVLIRIFDTCGKYEIPLAKALELKLQYNTTRPHRHGGKKL